jgi:hypothetical protein
MRDRALTRGRRIAGAIIAATSVALFAGSAHAVDLLPPVIPVVPPPPPPTCDNNFYASAYFLYMKRRNPPPTPLVSLKLNPGSGDVLDASDFSFGWRDGVGGRVGFIVCHFGVEAGAFAIRNWSSTVSSFPADNVFLETNPPTSAALIGEVDGLNRTEIFGADIHFVFQPNEHVQFYAGPAYIRLTDTLIIDLIPSITRTGAAPTDGAGTYRWDVLNSMIGPEIGVRGKVGSLTPGTFFLGGDAHFGVLFNRISNMMSVDRPDPVPSDLTGNDTANSIVTMLGGAVQVGFQATANLSLTVGYRALFLHNVALAPNQVSQAPNLNVLGPAVVPIGTAAGSNFLAHGLEIGIHLQF